MFWQPAGWMAIKPLWSIIGSKVDGRYPNAIFSPGIMEFRNSFSTHIQEKLKENTTISFTTNIEELRVTQNTGWLVRISVVIFAIYNTMH